MENKGFSFIVGLSVALHAVVLYAWTGPLFKPPVVDLVVGQMSVALTLIPEEPVEEPAKKKRNTKKKAAGKKSEGVSPKKKRAARSPAKKKNA